MKLPTHLCENSIEVVQRGTLEFQTLAGHVHQGFIVEHNVDCTRPAIRGKCEDSVVGFRHRDGIHSTRKHREVDQSRFWELLPDRLKQG